MTYTPRASTAFVAVHCSATKPSAHVDEDTIRLWHLQRGWQDFGYNIVILRDGTVQIGRPIDYQGAHVEGFNSKAMGICLIGGLAESTGEPEDNYTGNQKAALLTTLRFCKLYAKDARIQGHRDFPGVTKACPCFDVRAWLRTVAPELL